MLAGEGDWDEDVWYGVQRFFDWLETKSYKMHIRVLLSKYRSYTQCPDCKGARLKPEALATRIGGKNRNVASAPVKRGRKSGTVRVYRSTSQSTVQISR